MFTYVSVFLREGKGAGQSGSESDWKFEVWATTNFPPGKVTKKLLDSCKTLPGNYLVQVGKPE